MHLVRVHRDSPAARVDAEIDGGSFAFPGRAVEAVNVQEAMLERQAELHRLLEAEHNVDLADYVKM